jgi:hypothetical protein
MEGDKDQVRGGGGILMGVWGHWGSLLLRGMRSRLPFNLHAEGWLVCITFDRECTSL